MKRGRTSLRLLFAGSMLLALLVISVPAQAVAQWHTTTVDSVGNVGEYTSFVLDSSDLAHISYFDQTNGVLKYAVQDAGGWQIETVDADGHTGLYTSLALDSQGYPHISYYNQTDGDLKYAYQDTDGWHISTVDSDGDVGEFTSLALDSDGFPRISYKDAGNNFLKYTYQDADGWHPITVDSSGYTGDETSLALDSNDYPHIAYYTNQSGDLDYAYQDTGGWHLESVDTDGVVGRTPSLKLDSSDYPHISYLDDTDGQLDYAYQDGDGWHLVTIATVNSTGFDSLALDSNGYPHISYFDYHDLDLKYAYEDADGWHFETVDGSTQVGWYTSLALDSDGNPHIAYYSFYSDDLEYAVFGDDSTAPTTSASAITADTANYVFGSWTNQNVTVTLSATDSGGSGVNGTFYTLDGGTQLTYNTPFTISDAGDHTVTFWSTDGDGNVETAQTVHVKIDTSSPTTSASAAQTDTSAYTFDDWTNQNVTVTLTPTDTGGSGLSSTTYTIDSGGQQTYTTSFTLNSDGDHTVAFVSTDQAGNTETSQTVHVKIDKAEPTISGAPTTNPNSNGWYNGAVTIHWTCGDALSGVATCPGDQVIGIEGTNQTISGTASDNAGNSVTVSSQAVSIDLTAPTISGAATTNPNSNDWYNASVSIHWTCADTLSGIATCPVDQTISNEGANQTVAGVATDNAGNSTEATSSPPVSLDLTSPTVSYSGNHGSYTVDQTVTITCSATDALSGIASSTCQNITGPAANFAVGVNNFSASATDNAGNTGSGSTSFTIGVTSQSLCTLTTQYAGNSRTGNQLCGPLELVQLANLAHNSRLKASAINSYILLVSTQRGRGLTTQQVNTLIQFARSL